MLKNTLSIGSEVFAKVNPDLKLIISQYLKRIRFRAVNGNLSLKDLVHFKLELIPVQVPVK